MKALLSFSILLAPALALGQITNHVITVTVKDATEARVPGLSLSIEKDGKPVEKNGYAVGALTDLNGQARFELSPGNYRISSPAVNDSKFSLFLLITEQGPNPNAAEVTVDSSALCGAESMAPQIIKSVTPKYPPAARAVRAMGTVVVKVKIRPDGTVASSEAISGHPLMRAISKQAALDFQFAGSEDNERSAILEFVFLDFAEASAGVRVYECPTRILVTAAAATIDY